MLPTPALWSAQFAASISKVYPTLVSFLPRSFGCVDLMHTCRISSVRPMLAF